MNVAAAACLALKVSGFKYALPNNVNAIPWVWHKQNTANSVATGNTCCCGSNELNKHTLQAKINCLCITHIWPGLRIWTNSLYRKWFKKHIQMIVSKLCIATTLASVPPEFRGYKHQFAGHCSGFRFVVDGHSWGQVTFVLLNPDQSVW